MRARICTVGTVNLVNVSIDKYVITDKTALNTLYTDRVWRVPLKTRRYMFSASVVISRYLQYCACTAQLKIDVLFFGYKLYFGRISVF